jgi:hypothetical protein
MPFFFPCKARPKHLTWKKKPALLTNCFEYRYLITIGQPKKAGDSAYSRYEIIFFIIYKSGCNKIYRDRTSYSSYDTPNLLSTFNCRVPMEKG